MKKKSVFHMKMTVGYIHKTNSKVFIALPLGCVILISFVTKDFDYWDTLRMLNYLTVCIIVC